MAIERYVIEQGDAADSADLADVLLSGAAEFEVLVRNGSDQWVNQQLGTQSIANSAVSLSKIANAAANDKLLGSGDSGSGSPYAEITLGSGLTMTGTTLSSSGGGTAGDSDYVLVDRTALNQVVADHISRTVEGDARGTNAVDLMMLRNLSSQVASGLTSVLLGGEDNQVGGVHSVVCGGDTNRVDAVEGFTGGGRSNFITSSAGNACVITGGNNNTITGDQDSATIGGGRDNLTARHNTTIPGGNNADGRRFGEWAYGGGSAANAQVVQNVATALTTDATQTTMGYTNNQSTWTGAQIDDATIPFPSALTFMLSFSGICVGMRANSAGQDACGFEIKGLMKKQDDGTVSFVGTPTVIELGTDDSNLDVDIVLAGSNFGANVRVTGIAAQDFVWTFAWTGTEMLVPAL